MTAVPAAPLPAGPFHPAGDDTAARVGECASCAAPYDEQEGWDGECLSCAVLAQAHRDGTHAARPAPECRLC